MLILWIHVCSCLWWLWKVISYGDDPALTEEFLAAQPWKGEYPGLNTGAGKVEAYIISLYVTTMTITTVGYGDISAENNYERVGYIVMFIAGAFVWGNLLAGEKLVCMCAVS